MPMLRDGWKQKRKDKRTEQYWKRQMTERLLSDYEQYQCDCNFIEIDYGERPSNNGLDLCNPAFAFHTSLAKWIVT